MCACKVSFCHFHGLLNCLTQGVGMPRGWTILLSIKCSPRGEVGDKKLQLEICAFSSAPVQNGTRMQRDEGETVTHECACLRTDQDTTRPFQRVRCWMPHNSHLSQHGSDSERITGCHSRHMATTRLRTASARCHTNFNRLNSAQSGEFLTGSRRTAATQL